MTRLHHLMSLCSILTVLIGLISLVSPSYFDAVIYGLQIRNLFLPLAVIMLFSSSTVFYPTLRRSLSKPLWEVIGNVKRGIWRVFFPEKRKIELTGISSFLKKFPPRIKKGPLGSYYLDTCLHQSCYHVTCCLCGQFNTRERSIYILDDETILWRGQRTLRKLT